MKKRGAKNQTHSKWVEKMMTKKVPIVSVNTRIGDIKKLLFKKTKKFETINYVYLINEHDKLKGVISIKELFRQTKNKKVKDVMTKKIISVGPHTHIEKATYLAVKHNIKSVPVVDKDNVFLGAISNDDILHETYKKTRVSMLHLAGVHRPKIVVDNVFKLSIWQSFKHRFPWLFIGLLGGIAAAKIIGLFENTLKENIILAAFLPLIVYVSGAMVTQMQAFIIRDLAMNSKLNFIKYFFRQFGIVLLIGIFASISLCVISFIMFGEIVIGFVLSIALFTAIVSSVMVGLIFPYTLSKMRFDPANASGPIAAIIQDILSIVVYFSVATWLM